MFGMCHPLSVVNKQNFKKDKNELNLQRAPLVKYKNIR